MLGASKSIWGFDPRSIPGCTLWLDGADNATMNSTSAVTVWNDKSGQSNTMTGTGTWSNGTMVFNGTTNAFSNLSYVFPFGAYSMFAVYSNTTAPTAAAYMNAVYGSNGFPMMGTFDVAKNVSARSVVANTGALTGTTRSGWAAQITSTGTDIGYGVATDTSGNVFVTGSYGAALTLYEASGSAVPLQWTGGTDVFVAKYSSAGAVLWAARIAGTTTSADIGRGVATDTSGNVLVTGSYGAALTLFNSSGVSNASLPFTGGTDVFVAKYSSAGAVLWAAQIAGATTSADIGRGIATDISGNVVVTGSYGAALTLFNSSGVSNASLPFTGGTDVFVAKYSSAGAVLWAAQIAGTTTSSDIGFGVATDTSGNVLVTGSYGAALTLFNSSGVSNASLPFTGSGDCFVAKYSSAGAVLWAAQIAGTGGDVGYGIATDISGNVVVTGSYGAALTLFNSSGVSNASLPFIAGNDCFVAKYSSAGAVLWAAQIAGATTVSEIGNAVTTDPSGNVFVTGNSGAGGLILYNTDGTAGVTLNVGESFCFVAKYSSAGTVVWGVRINGGTGSVAVGNGIATDSSGNSFITGYYATTAMSFANAAGSFGAGIPLPSGTDAFIAKYSPIGYITSNSPTFAPSNIVVSATYSSLGLIPFVNGFPQSSRNGTTLATTGIFVGGPSNYFNGTISEVIVYGTTLRDTQRQSVEGYLSGKWGIGTQLISTHRYYTIPPLSRTFSPNDVPGCSLWLDGADNSSMNSTSTVTSWSDKSGLNNTMTGTATWTGRTMSFNGSTQAFSNTSYVFPTSNYSMFAVYSNTTAPTAAAYMNVIYGSNGFPMLGIFGSSKFVSARSVVANTGALTPNVAASSNVLVSATKTSSNFSPFVNGSTATTLSGFTAATTGIFVGGPSNYFNGTISELLIYGANLSEADRRQVEGYLIQKWGLSAQTVSNHQYKLIPPATSQPGQFAEVTQGNWTRDWQPHLRSLVATNNPTNATIIPTVSYGTNSLSLALSLQKYNGGVLAPNGNIYCAPNATTSILVINPTTNNVGYITPTLNPILASMSYWGGVLAPNDIIYYVPYSSSNVLVFNVATYGISYTGTGDAPALNTQLYHGGALAPNGLIYCAPYAASNVLIINPTTNGVSYGIGTLSPALVTQPYSGAVLAPNGNVYCIPNGASNILIIDGTGSGTAATYGTNSLTPALSTQKYDGGVLAPNGNIYCVPSGASNILIINPTTNTVSYGTGGPALSPALSTQLYIGGVLAPNGNIYCIPNSNSSNVLIINPTTNGVSYGTNSLSPALSTQRYSGGVLAPNGNIYGVPSVASNILIISNTYSQLPSSNYCLSAYANKI